MMLAQRQQHSPGGHDYLEHGPAVHSHCAGALGEARTGGSVTFWGVRYRKVRQQGSNARAARLGSAAAAAAAAADVPLAIRWLIWQWTAGEGPTRASGGVAEDKLKLHRRASQLASAP